MAVSVVAARPVGTRPDRYTDQLTEGFRLLRFSPALEAEYRRQLIAECQRPALVVALAALFIWSCFAALDFVRLELFSHMPATVEDWTILAVRWITMAGLVLYLTPWARGGPYADIAAMGVYVLIGSAAAISTVLYQGMHMPSGYANLIVVTMAAFLPLGMRFYMALSACLIVVLVTALVGFAVDTGWNGHAYLVSVMVIGVLVASVGGFLHEKAHRRQFLLSAVLSRQAQFDPMTNLGNRRLFEQQASAALAQARRTGVPVVMALVDVDHFKRFNDRYGHAAGDNALRGIAIELEQTARRPLDTVARLGGEEFAVLLFDTDIDAASIVLDDLRLRIATRNFPGTDGITVSIGATLFAPDQDDLLLLYERADRLLYDSKDGGRNRVTMD